MKGTLTPFERSPGRYFQNHSSRNFKIERKIKKRPAAEKWESVAGFLGASVWRLTDHTKGASIRRSFCDPIKNKYLIWKVGPYLVFISFLSRLWSRLVQPSDLIMVNRDVIKFRKFGKMFPVSCGACDPEGARIPCCLVAMLLSLCINHRLSCTWCRSTRSASLVCLPPPSYPLTVITLWPDFLEFSNSGTDFLYFSPNSYKAVSWSRCRAPRSRA